MTISNSSAYIRSRAAGDERQDKPPPETPRTSHRAIERSEPGSNDASHASQEHRIGTALHGVARSADARHAAHAHGSRQPNFRSYFLLVISFLPRFLLVGIFVLF